MSKNISQEFRLIKIEETRNYHIREIGEIELMSKKHKKGLYNSKLYRSLS